MQTRAPCLHGIIIVLSILWCPLPSQAYEFAGGTGEPNDPYQIATAEQLISIGSDPNLLDKHFVLLNDIDLDPNLPGGRVFTRAVIAPDLDGMLGFQGVAFTGVFDGDGYTIRNLVIDTGGNFDGGDRLALFGTLGGQAVVRNLGVETDNGGMYGNDRGALAGHNEGCIIDCHAKASRIAGTASVGGLVGYNAGDIIRCHVDCERILGSEHVGGLVGHNWRGGRIIGCSAAVSTIGLTTWAAGGLVGFNHGSITDSCAAGSVSLEGQFASTAGGLVGRALASSAISRCHSSVNISAKGKGGHSGGLVGDMGGRIDNCYATGNVSGGDMSMGLGGLVAGNTGQIRNCYAAGRVSGGDGSRALGGLVGVSDGIIVDCYAIGQVSAGKDSRDAGGLIGLDGGSSVKASFWDIEASGLPESAGGTGLATSEMQDPNTYEAAGWDLVGEEANGTADIWFIPRSGGYPALAVLCGR